MKTFDPQVRLRKLIAVVAVLSCVSTTNIARALASDEITGAGSAVPLPAPNLQNSGISPALNQQGLGYKPASAGTLPSPQGAGDAPTLNQHGGNPGNAGTLSAPNPQSAGSNAGIPNPQSAGSDAGSAGILPAPNLQSAGMLTPPSSTGATPTIKTTPPPVSGWDAPVSKPVHAGGTSSQGSARSPMRGSSAQLPVFGVPGKAQAAPMPAPSRSEQSSTDPKSSTGKDAGTGSSANNGGNNKTSTTSSTTSVPTSSTTPLSSGPFGSTAKGVQGDSYPSVGRMEKLTFGATQGDSPIEERLSKLETAIYQKSFADLSLFDRTQQLKKTLLGNDEEPTADIDNLRVPQNNWLGNPLATTDQSGGEYDYFEGIAQRPENQQTTTPEDMKDFALELINSERSKSGFGPLAIDSLADKIAKEHNQELCQRNVISHANSKGENPDRRYTVGGGTGAMTESLVSNKTPDTFSKSPTRAAVAGIMKTLMSRQDDRDTILNPDATHIGFAMNWTANKDRVIAVTEVVTNHGIIPELPFEVPIGEKLEIKGVVMQPYQFDRITVAWEANKALASAADESEEALPYFPPLDYVAYAGKSMHDYSGAMTALRTAGVIAAIAGGMFMPPIALAAPLIAMSGGMGSGEPKPVSDIPIHGGVKVEGLTFNGKVPLNKEGKEGIYYVTIWGTISKLNKSVPISRRAILAKHVDEDVSARIETPGEETPPKEKKEKHKKSK